MLTRCKRLLNDTPLWFINLITIISGLITIVTPIIGIIIGLRKPTHRLPFIVTIIVLSAFILILFFRMRKYRNISNKRMEKTSDNFQKLLRDARDIYFDVMHSHKKDTLTVGELTAIYKNRLVTILDDLCDVMSAFTGRKTSACIKLIAYQEDEEIIHTDNAALITFCRSNNSDTDRGIYEKNHEILLKDNTDYFDIVSGNCRKGYFYQSDLKKYDEALKKVEKRYRNTNEEWNRYYTGTITIPIQIEFKRLYHQKKDDAYHIIGFLCVDSLSADAFTEKQEKYNVDLVKSFANIIYILLSQYRHYLKKLEPPVEPPKKENIDKSC